MARLAVNALNKILARYPEIRTVLDCGCGDMAWMQYFLKEHPFLTYVGVDIMPYCLAVNFRRFPKMHFIQTDLSNLTGVEVLPLGCDLIIAKDRFHSDVNSTFWLRITNFGVGSGTQDEQPSCFNAVMSDVVC